MKGWKESISFFLGRYLTAHRGLSPETQASSATALRFWTGWLRKRGRPLPPPAAVTVRDVLDFLGWLEEARGNSVQTRNLRWAALQSFWTAMKVFEPDHADSFERLLETPRKRSVRGSPDYLELRELKHLLGLCDVRSSAGFHHFTLFRYAYNTGSRISEIAQARCEWLRLAAPHEVTIRGKGGKWRVCPLWESTAQLLKVYLEKERPKPRPGYEEFLFISRLGKPWTRKGLWKLMKGYFRKARSTMASLAHKDLSPHSLRHTCAVHLLRAGVDLTVIKAWLGHSDVATTARYIDLDLDKKREALGKFESLDVERLVGTEGNERLVLPAATLDWLEGL
jgi:site-specific recombinase XerD